MAPKEGLGWWNGWIHRRVEKEGRVGGKCMNRKTDNGNDNFAPSRVF